MLFAKLLLSPVPHAHIRSIDTQEALAMPGVKAILTVDDLPAPADAMTDLGQVIPANKLGERGLTNDPVYQGEPILAVCAVDELHLRRGYRENQNRLRTFAARGRSAGEPASRRSQRTSGRQRLGAADPAPPVKGQPPPPPPAPLGSRTQVDRRGFRERQRRPAAHGQSHRSLVLRRLGSGPEECAPGSGRNFRHAQHQPPDARNPHRDGVLAKRQGLRSLLARKAPRRPSLPLARWLHHGCRAT